MSVKKFDKTITHDDMWLIIHAHIKEHGLSHDAIDSMDDFYRAGIPQIMTTVFKIENTIVNVRDKSLQDKSIAKIKFRVTFNNITMRNPITPGYSSGQELPIYPLQATLQDRTYSSNMDADAKVEAWAYTKDGNEIYRVAEKPGFRVAAIPTMVGTYLCNTYGKAKSALQAIKEDPDNPGAYFIRGGREWSIDNVESVAYNQDRAFENNWKTEIQRIELISKPGDTYQNSKQIILRLLNNGCITLEIGSALRDIQFPFYMIFRALGWATDKQMLDHILYQSVGYPNEDRKMDPLVARMYGILRVGMTANYDSKTQKFGSPTTIHTPIEVLQYLVKHMPKKSFDGIDLTKDQDMQQAINDFLRHMDEDFLPHIGMDEKSRPDKLRFLGLLINRMMLVHLGLREQTDRDSHAFKRVHRPGVSMAKTFKTHYGSVVSHLIKQFVKDFKAISFSSVNLINTLTVGFNGNDLERLLMQSITSGNKTNLKVDKHRTIVNRLSSQLLNRLNQTKVFSTIRMITSPGSDASKGSDRAKEMRMPHLSAQGHIDLVQSPDGGPKVGMQKQIAISAYITGYASSEVLKNKLLADTTRVTKLSAVHPYDVPRMRPVFVNGHWIGCTPDTSQLVEHYTRERRALRIDRYTTIQWDNEDDMVYFWVDYGRMRRPLVIVYNNIRDWQFLGLSEPAPPEKFEQFVSLTQTHLAKMRDKKMTTEDLLKQQIIEYITPGEQIRLDIAADITHLKQYVNDPLRQFTHCDIPEAMLGIAALTGVLANYNHTPRNTFQTSQVRQTGGKYVYNWASRIDKDTFLQYRVGRPLVHTRINSYIRDNGDTAMVAVMCYSGYNQEDSNAMNKTLGERLKFVGCQFNYEKVELEGSEMFAIPDSTRTTGIKNYANYSKLGKDGIVPNGTIVRKGDVLVGKIKRLPKNVAAERKVEYSDQSLVYKNEFDAQVHNVLIGKDDEAVTFVKIALKSIKPIIIGDKFSARSGQKGVCGILTNQSDMPFTEDGMAVDILINPHSFPKRMTVGQLYESGLGSICAARGATCDGTAFRKLEIDDLVAAFKRLGMDHFGRKRLYCGLNGAWIDSLIFVGPVYYQRLLKFVAKSIYAIDVGPTDIITRQPLDGKANQGGLRISELQRDVFLAHGAARTLSCKMFNDSDDFALHICRCGYRAICNLDADTYKCQKCGDSADINVVHSCWASKQLFMELNSMNIGTRTFLRPFTFYTQK